MQKTILGTNVDQKCTAVVEDGVLALAQQISFNKNAKFVQKQVRQTKKERRRMAKTERCKPNQEPASGSSATDR